MLDEDAAKKIDISFAYYPYHDTIKSVVSFNGLEEGAIFVQDDAPFEITYEGGTGGASIVLTRFA